MRLTITYGRYTINVRPALIDETLHVITLHRSRRVTQTWYGGFSAEDHILIWTRIAKNRVEIDNEIHNAVRYILPPALLTRDLI